MFCNHCGVFLPDGSQHCSQCGAPQTSAFQQSAEDATLPVFYNNPPQDTTAAYAQPSVSPQQPLPEKKSSLPITITFILSMLLIVASILVPLTRSFFNIPIVSLVGNAIDSDFYDEVDYLEESSEELQEEYEEFEDELSPDERAAFKTLIRGIKTPSLFNLARACKAAEELEDYGYSREDAALAEEFSLLIMVVLCISIGAFLLPLVFALLGGIKKNTILTILAMVFTIIPQLFLCGLLFVLLSLAVYIPQIVLCQKYKTA